VLQRARALLLDDNDAFKTCHRFDRNRDNMLILVHLSLEWARHAHPFPPAPHTVAESTLSLGESSETRYCYSQTVSLASFAYSWLLRPTRRPTAECPSSSRRLRRSSSFFATYPGSCTEARACRPERNRLSTCSKRVALHGIAQRMTNVRRDRGEDGTVGAPCKICGALRVHAGPVHVKPGE